MITNINFFLIAYDKNAYCFNYLFILWENNLIS